ncbi:MAG TPA: hypothetical protein VGV39_08180 [Mesorhizobium sp.]|jgi:hypothetical protein|uniref:hypothetical protein n=1 Tax=Mesorhizobium sp. TaxID=1871066 RepID=UPI002DDCAF42|nr:hypothetical protein [Mesorhizobium sp.]HEV2503040.1 hypothetical protein [Mesorhizobium sp.]
MRGMAVAFFGLWIAGTAQASSLVYISDAAPAATPSVIAPTADPTAGRSVVLAGETEMPVTQEKVAAIPRRTGPAGATMVIRDGVVGAALPRHAAKPAIANGKLPATAVSAKPGKDGLAGEHNPKVTR